MPYQSQAGEWQGSNFIVTNTSHCWSNPPTATLPQQRCTTTPASNNNHSTECHYQSTDATTRKTEAQAQVIKSHLPKKAQSRHRQQTLPASAIARTNAGKDHHQSAMTHTQTPLTDEK
jgi:hypothetical protein